MEKQRINLAHFDLPIDEIRRGYRSDVYFWRSKVILENDNHPVQSLMQIFQKNEAVLCGVDEALGILKVGTGVYTNRRRAYELFDTLMSLKQKMRLIEKQDRNKYLEYFNERIRVEEELDSLWQSAYRRLDIKTLNDGDSISPQETVMHLEGELHTFVHLETVYLGVLARRTKIATNVRKVVIAAGEKPVLFFPARFDHWSLEGGDGYAAKIGGAADVSTHAQASWWGGRGIGTIPHALIASYGGDTVKATEKFADAYPDINVISLVDFHNDCVNTSLEVARALGERLWGVRLDTSEHMVDKSLSGRKDREKYSGVCRELVCNVRRALDREGYEQVKIVVSGGFNEEKIRAFERSSVPVDAYGVGSSLLKGGFDFTADVVKVNGTPCAKTGRRYKPNPRLFAEGKYEY